jgi:hypothetical protein
LITAAAVISVSGSAAAAKKKPIRSGCSIAFVTG